jgi:hypothetical protein
MADKPETQADAPEQFVHGAKPITGALVGTVLDTNGTINQILYTGPPTSYEIPQFDPGSGLPTKGYFTLIDTGFTPPVVLFSTNGHNNGAHSPHATHKMAGYLIPFISLVLQSCPAGATYSVTTQ